MSHRKLRKDARYVVGLGGPLLQVTPSSYLSIWKRRWGESRTGRYAVRTSEPDKIGEAQGGLDGGLSCGYDGHEKVNR
jgi:hypothetical protein